MAYNLSKLAGLNDLWHETLGSPEICIAVLDGAVDESHPCFRTAKLTQLESLVSSVGEGPASQHGTHVASVIFGQHGGPVTGIAPRCRGLIIPVFRESPSGSVLPCSQLDLTRGIALAVQHGAHVINISGGQFDPSGEAEPLLANAVRSCATNGVLIIAAAGNDGCECLHTPAALPTVIAVGAMDSRGSPLDSSNWGESYQKHGILAPGEDILGAEPGGGTASRHGTSSATPIVSGIVALLLSVQLRRGYKRDPSAVRDAIFSTALGCDSQPVHDCRQLLIGRLNIKGALSYLGRGEQSMDSDEHELTKAEDAKEVRPDMPAKMVSENAREQPITAKVEAAQLQRPEHEVGAIVQQPLAPGGVRPSETSLAVSVEPNQINALECPACEASSRSGIVYALGQIDYDFGTEGTRDSLVQSGLSNPHDPGQLLAYLERSPSHATALIWTLTQEGTPIYAIQPAGAFAADIYGRLREFLQGQLNEGVERCSIPGVLGGKATLLNGQVVPIIYPELRGMYSWNTSALVRAVCGEPVGESAAAKERDAYMHKTQAVQNFLERVYYEVRNIGVMPQERAMNCAVTNASNAEKIFESALKEGKELDAIEVERSPIGRPGSECWDVKLTFFNPSRRLDQARRVYRFCIDVSNPIPVTVGNVRQWHVY